MYDGKRVVAVVAIGKNRELGFENKLLWHIPEDLKRFKQFTEGHPVIMGRKTFKSILGYLKKPLPNRTNIVVTRDPDALLATYAEAAKAWENFIAVATPEAALAEASKSPGSEEIHIGGGAQLYEQMLPYIDTLYLTIVDAEPQADSFFPEYENTFTRIKEERGESGGVTYTFADFERR